MARYRIEIEIEDGTCELAADTIFTNKSIAERVYRAALKSPAFDAVRYFITKQAPDGDWLVIERGCVAR